MVSDENKNQPHVLQSMFQHEVSDGFYFYAGIIIP